MIVMVAAPRLSFLIVYFVACWRVVVGSMVPLRGCGLFLVFRLEEATPREKYFACDVLRSATKILPYGICLIRDVRMGVKRTQARMKA